jgi:hypothetical protein
MTRLTVIKERSIDLSQVCIDVLQEDGQWRLHTNFQDRNCAQDSDVSPSEQPPSFPPAEVTEPLLHLEGLPEALGIDGRSAQETGEIQQIPGVGSTQDLIDLEDRELLSGLDLVEDWSVNANPTPDLTSIGNSDPDLLQQSEDPVTHCVLDVNQGLFPVIESLDHDFEPIGTFLDNSGFSFFDPREPFHIRRPDLTMGQFLLDPFSRCRRWLDGLLFSQFERELKMEGNAVHSE